MVLRNSLYQHSNSQPLSYKLGALAIELNSSKAIAGKELSLSCWCIASLYIYHCSTVVDFSSEKCVELAAFLYVFFVRKIFLCCLFCDTIVFEIGSSSFYKCKVSSRTFCSTLKLVSVLKKCKTYIGQKSINPKSDLSEVKHHKNIQGKVD